MVIAITIMAVLITYSNKAVQNGLRAKTKIQDQIDAYSAVRDALRVMTEDIGLAYHYRDIDQEFKNAVLTASKSQAQAPPPPPPGQPAAADPNAQARAQTQAALQQWQQKDPYRVDPTTQFWGSDSEMHLITTHAARLREDQQQADFVKVGYSLSDCKKPGDTGSSSKCLMRSETNAVEGDVKKEGAKTILAENVSEFKLRYIGQGKTDWVSEWDSKTGDGATQNNFPEAVEISLTTLKGEGEKRKKVTMRTIAPVHFPNNVPSSGSSLGASPQNGPNGQPNGAVSDGAIP
jgi:hypothetical protein